MERKKQNSFVLYTDYIQHVSLLSDQEAGQLFKGLFHFVEDGTVPDFSGSLMMCFSFISSQIQRDKAKYADICEKRAVAGSKGGKQKQANLASANFVKQKQANLADTDNVNETGNVNETENNIYMVNFIDRICQLLNSGRERKGSKGRLRVTENASKIIEELLESGARPELIEETALEMGGSVSVDWYELRKVVLDAEAKGGI